MGTGSYSGGYGKGDEGPGNSKSKSGGYSGKGGSDSPSEGGPGPGGSANSGGKSSGGGYSGKGGNDSPSEGGGRFGGSGLSGGKSDSRDYSGNGGKDSPSEGGPGPGGGSKSSGGSKESTGGRGRDGYGASSARSGTTRSGSDSPSESGSRFGGKGLMNAGDAPTGFDPGSVGSKKGNKTGGASPRGARPNYSAPEQETMYDKLKRTERDMELKQIDRDNWEFSENEDKKSFAPTEQPVSDRTPAPTSTPSPARPDNKAYTGPKGLGGVGGLYVGGAPVDQTRARAEMAASMDAAGIRSLAGKPAPSAMSHRESEIQSMQDLTKMTAEAAAQKAPSHRQAELASMDKMRAWDGILGLARKDAAAIDPYNSLTYAKKGVKGLPSHTNLTDMTIGEVMAYQKEMKRKGHASTAVGAYQTIAPTLEAAVKRTNLSLDTKFTPATQDFLAMDLVADRARKATVNGVVDVDKFADQLTKEWASFKNATGKSSYEGINQNKGYVGYDSVRSAAANLVGSGTIGGKATSPLGSVPGTQKEDRLGFAQTPSVGPTPAPADRFRDKYLNTRPGRLSDENALKTVSPEEDYFGEQPSAQFDQNPGGIPIGGANSPPGSVAPASPSLAGPATRGPATQGPAGTVAPGSPAPAQPAPAQPAPDKPYQRSTAGSIVAGAIDVGLGMTGVPGMGVGLFNAGAQLMGKPTIGQSIVDRMAQGKDVNTGSTESKGDRTRAREEERRAAGKEDGVEEKEEEVITSTGPRFIDKYLRPTPKERFLDDRGNYAGREFPETLGA